MESKSLAGLSHYEIIRIMLRKYTATEKGAPILEAHERISGRSGVCPVCDNKMYYVESPYYEASMCGRCGNVYPIEPG